MKKLGFEIFENCEDIGPMYGIDVERSNDLEKALERIVNKKLNDPEIEKFNYGTLIAIAIDLAENEKELMLMNFFAGVLHAKIELMIETEAKVKIHPQSN